MLANGASKCEDIETLIKYKEILDEKIIQGQPSNELFEAGLLLLLGEVTTNFTWNYIDYFNKNKYIDLHGFNAEHLEKILNWVATNCELPQTIIFGRASHTVGDENKMKDALEQWLNGNNVMEKKIVFKIHPKNEGCFILPNAETRS